MKDTKKTRSKAAKDSKTGETSKEAKDSKTEETPKKATAKAKAKAKAKVEKVPPTKRDEAVKKRPAARKVDIPPPPEEPAPKASRTWAGRWIPEDESGASFRKFQAIRKVFELFVAPKLVRQSAAQSPFFKSCTAAFKEHGVDKDDTTMDQFVATAELQVENFMNMESTRTLTIFGNRFSSNMPNPKLICNPELI